MQCENWNICRLWRPWLGNYFHDFFPKQINKVNIKQREVTCRIIMRKISFMRWISVCGTGFVFSELIVTSQKLCYVLVALATKQFSFQFHFVFFEEELNYKWTFIRAVCILKIKEQGPFGNNGPNLQTLVWR